MDGVVYTTISHPYIIHALENVHTSRPPEKNALDEVAAEEQGNCRHLNMSARFRHIREHVHGIMDDSQVESREV